MKQDKIAIQENKLLLSTSTPSALTVRIAVKLNELRLLTDYPANEEFGIKMLEWGGELERLVSIEDLKKLPFLLDCFKLDKLHYDHNLGIRNITMGFKEVIENEDGSYKIRSQQRY